MPHDIEVRPSKTPLKVAKVEKPIHEDDANVDQAEVNALFAAANDLPADDPLRQSQQAVPQQAQQAAVQAPQAATAPANAKANPNVSGQHETSSNQAESAAPSPPPRSTFVSVSDGKKINVPTLVGLPIRAVIEMTAAEGLQLQINGSGTVREQAPAPGTQVPSGTKIIVRCGR